MDQTQRHKDCFYRTRAKAEQLKCDVARWKAVADVAAKELEATVAEVLALKAEVERMKAEHQGEVDGLHETLISMRDELSAEKARLDWLETEGGCGGAKGSWSAYTLGPGWEREAWAAATLREAVDEAMKGST